MGNNPEKEDQKMEQKINITGSQNITNIQAGRDVYYGEAKEMQKIGVTDKDLEELINIYLERVGEEWKKERLKEHELGREGVYIEPELMLRKEIEKEEKPLQDERQRKEKGYELSKINIASLLREKTARYIVVADSGMGKTTFLRELALMIAEKRITTELVPASDIPALFLFSYFLS